MISSSKESLSQARRHKRNSTRVVISERRTLVLEIKTTGSSDETRTRRAGSEAVVEVVEVVAVAVVDEVGVAVMVDVATATQTDKSKHPQLLS